MIRSFCSRMAEMLRYIHFGGASSGIFSKMFSHDRPFPDFRSLATATAPTATSKTRDNFMVAILGGE